MCVREAIESAVVFLIVRGVANQQWALSDKRDWDTPLIKAYLQDEPIPPTRRQKLNAFFPGSAVLLLMFAMHYRSRRPRRPRRTRAGA